MNWTTLEIFRDGPVGWLVFDRPDSGNAIDARMFVELERAWHELDEDEEVRVIVNTGNGRSFQTGLDAESAVGMALSPPVLVGHARTFPLAGLLPISMLLDLPRHRSSER